MKEKVDCKGLTFEDCELAILRMAVDKAEEKMGKRIVNSEDIKNIIRIVEDFIRLKNLICYGGTAINNILPEEDQFYNKEVEWINSSVKGLKGKPVTTFNTSDTSSIVEPIGVTGNGQFSVCNKKVLTDLIKSKPHASLFVEIGTASAYTASSTETIINNKTENCLFYTIDIDERVLSVEGLHGNISIIQSDSTGDRVKELLQDT